MMTTNGIFMIDGHPEMVEIVDLFEAKLSVKLMARTPDDEVHGYINARKFYEDNDVSKPMTEVEVCLYENDELPTDQADATVAQAIAIASEGKTKKEKAEIRQKMMRVLGGHTTTLKSAPYFKNKKRDLKNHMKKVKGKKLSIEQIGSILITAGGTKNG